MKSVLVLGASDFVLPDVPMILRAHHADESVRPVVCCACGRGVSADEAFPVGRGRWLCPECDRQGDEAGVDDE
jgi:hypothetical protein